MEYTSIAVSSILCTVIFLNILLKLRKVCPYPVNCWFCNCNSWVVFPERNSWICPNCDQYNGFTKDGDYNKALPFRQSEQKIKTKKSKQPPSNGLCKMCNVNQQLKVAQLANFVPINEKNFNSEIDAYRSQLENAYKLCSVCTKHLKAKLHYEKQTLLNLRLIKSKTPESLNSEKEILPRKKSRFLKYLYLCMTLTLVLIILLDIYIKFNNDAILKETTIQIYQVTLDIVGDLFMMMKNWLLANFPDLKKLRNIEVTLPSIDVMETISNLDLGLLSVEISIDRIIGNSIIIQRILCGAGMILHMICHFINIDVVAYRVTAEILWSLLVIGSIVTVNPMTMYFLLVKLIISLVLCGLYANFNTLSPTSPTKKQKSPKAMKNLVKNSPNTTVQEDDQSSSDDETDDDVSLSKFGINNSHSSSDGHNFSKESYLSGRAFSPQCQTWNSSMWNSTLKTKKHNSTTRSKSKSLIRHSKLNPKQGKHIENDSDSDLDESINGLHLGNSPKKFTQQNGVFQLKQFCNIKSGFATPLIMPVSQRRPLISPSKLGNGMSWVAGGYWGNDSTRTTFDINGSRSSSQSSGFESQTSSANMRNNFGSQPSSREDSVNRELDKVSMMSDPFQNLHRFGASPSDVWSTCSSRLKSPIVHPQMRFDAHVNIPQVQNDKLFSSLSSLSINNYNLSRMNTIKRSQIANDNAFVSPLIKLPNMPESMDC